MGLQRCFRAEDLVQYLAWPGGWPPVVNYNSGLIATPRLYQEEFYSLASSAPPGLLWTEKEATPWGTTTVNLLSAVSQAPWPGWGVNRWKFDGQYGRALSRAQFSNLSNVTTAIGGGFAYEPSGFIWAFSGNPIVTGFGAVVVNQRDMSYDVGLGAVAVDGFLTKDGADPIAISDFNIDRQADRLFVRWLANNAGQVSIYRYSTKAWLADIFTPNTTAGIVLTGDGFVYVADAADWICVYNYDGVYQAALRNPRKTAYPGGIAYGWDRYYKRLLYCGIPANATDGSCRARIMAAYPVPEAFDLSAPVPRQVPRKGRTITVVSHLSGEGAEPLAARRGQFSGDVVASAMSDRHGDLVLQVTPANVGSLALTVSVEAPATPADAVEPDHTTPGKTLVVALVSTKPDSTHADVTATVTGASGAVTVTFHFVAGMGDAEVVVSGAGPTFDVAGFDLSIHGGGWTVQASAVDATGNTGLSAVDWSLL